MRVSTSWSHHTSVNAMNNAQAKLQQTQLQLSTGKKILTPSDNPVAASRIIDINQRLAQAEQFQSNINRARDRLTMEESVLESATEILQRVRELGVQGLSGTNTANSRDAAAVEMEALNGQLLNLANTKGANGEYIFAGFKSSTQPFGRASGNPGAYAYAGDNNTRLLQIDTASQMADGDPGSAVFGNPTGSAPAAVPAPGSIANVFEAIGKFAADLKANAPDKASIGDITNALDRISRVRASVGARLNVLDRQEEVNTETALNTKAVLSEIEDLDYAEAISRFTQQQSSLQAAQQSFAQIKKLSLFNYL